MDKKNLPGAISEVQTVITVPPQTSNNGGSTAFICQSCGRSFKAHGGMSKHLSSNPECRDRLISTHWITDTSTPFTTDNDSMPCPFISVPNGNQEESNPNIPADISTNLQIYNSTCFWDQQYYDSMTDDNQKQDYINFYISEYGVSPPITLNDHGQIDDRNDSSSDIFIPNTEAVAGSQVLE